MEIELDLFSAIKIARDYLKTLNRGYEKNLDRYLMDGTINFTDKTLEEDQNNSSTVYYDKNERDGFSQM